LFLVINAARLLKAIAKLGTLLLLDAEDVRCLLDCDPVHGRSSLRLLTVTDRIAGLRGRCIGTLDVVLGWE
jgi:hypothetical protein